MTRVRLGAMAFKTGASMRYNTVVSYNFTVEHDGEEPTEEEVLGGFVEELVLLGLDPKKLPLSWPDEYHEFILPKAGKHHFEITDDVIVIMEEGT